jgi:hypothetical protein
MTELTALLERAADETVCIDAATTTSDLRRGHRALSRRRRRTWAGGAVAALALVTGGGVVTRLGTGHEQGLEPATHGASHGTTTDLRFTWADGPKLPSVGPLTLAFLGTSRPIALGDPVVHDGRTFYAVRNAGRDVVTVLDPSGEWIRLELRTPPHWTLTQSVDILAHVQVEHSSDVSH